MTRTIVEPLPHDLAVKAGLATTGRQVGFVVAPSGALAALKAGGPDYFVFHPITSSRDGSLGDAWSDASFRYQVDCVARLPDGARFLVGLIESALLGVAVAGRSVTQVVIENDGRLIVDRDVTPPIFVAQPEVVLSTVPT